MTIPRNDWEYLTFNDDDSLVGEEKGPVTIPRNGWEYLRLTMTIPSNGGERKIPVTIPSNNLEHLKSDKDDP